MTEAKKTATAAKKTVKKAAPAQKAVVSKIKKSDKTVYSTGRRKDSVARVYLTPGKGEIIINGTPMVQYFKRAVLQMILNQPFGVTKREGAFDVEAFVKGGGLSGQAGAIKHGISRVLEKSEPELRKELKASGFLTRDSRTVERKHYGKHKARRSTQFSKR